MAELLVAVASASKANLLGTQSLELTSGEPTPLEETKWQEGEFPPGTDFEILAELKSMSELALRCEFTSGIFPHLALSCAENNMELAFNAINITTVDSDISQIDVTVVCEAICKDKEASEKAKIELADKLGLKSSQDQCDLDKFKQICQGEVRKRDLSCWEGLYLTFASAEGGVFGKYFQDWILFLIIASTLSFVLETEPVFRTELNDCECVPSPINNSTCSPCEPSSPEAFFYVEAICIAFFTLEYLMRLFTVSMVRRDFIFDFTRGYDLILISSTPPKPEPSRAVNLFHWITNPMVVIDLLAIFPFFLSIGLADTGVHVNLSFLRVLRLLRVFRVLKLAKYSNGLRTFVSVLIRSKDALTVMVFFIALAMVLFGSMVYFAENGTWMVTADHPEGAYYRFAVNQQSLEVTPYLSIAASFWWVIVTVTTVGYGDFYPTSPGGKAVGALTMLSGVLTLALPITVIASNYANETAAQQAAATFEAIKLEKLTRRKELFAKKKASLKPKTPRANRHGVKPRLNPDTLRLLSCLAEVNHQTPWAVIPLLENEVRAVHAARVRYVDEPLQERELALDRFLIHALTMLRCHQPPATPQSISALRKELVEFYSGFSSVI